MTVPDVLDMPLDEVRAVLLDGYGVVPDSLDVVSGEIATVCRVTTGKSVYAFKAMPASGDEAALVRWQTSAMVRLAATGLPVPSIEHDRQGRLMFEHSSRGCDVLVLLTDWLIDPPLSDVVVDTRLLRDVGRTAARVTQALDGIEPPVAAGHAWELVRTHDTICKALPGVTDQGAASLVRRALDVFDNTLVPLLPDLPRSVIHHDLHDSNLLVGTGSDGQPAITGVLDFGDMVVGPRLAELAVAAAYAARNTSDPREALTQVAAGWSAVSPLTNAETYGLLPAAISRLATNLAVWAARNGGTRASYAASRSVGSEDTLDALLDLDASDFVVDLRRATRA